jgi:uncharacterized protein (TIGR00251 family)
MDTSGSQGADLSRAISETGDGAVVAVWVVPGASRTEILGIHGEALRIRVSAPADRGRANQAVTKLLADVSGKEVELLKGHRGHRKRFLVRGISPAELARRISRQ